LTRREIFLESGSRITKSGYFTHALGFNVTVIAEVVANSRDNGTVSLEFRGAGREWVMRDGCLGSPVTGCERG
jgi:hypothetical protein